jgi:predicted nucleotidyltransferase
MLEPPTVVLIPKSHSCCRTFALGIILDPRQARHRQTLRRNKHAATQTYTPQYFPHGPPCFCNTINEVDIIRKSRLHQSALMSSCQTPYTNERFRELRGYRHLDRRCVQFRHCLCLHSYPRFMLQNLVNFFNNHAPTKLDINIWPKAKRNQHLL